MRREFFDGGKVKPAECGQVDAVVGFAKGFSRSSNAVPEEKESATLEVDPALGQGLRRFGA